MLKTITSPRAHQTALRMELALVENEEIVDFGFATLPQAESLQDLNHNDIVDEMVPA
jgi:hypothetical protein